MRVFTWLGYGRIIRLNSEIINPNSHDQGAVCFVPRGFGRPLPLSTKPEKGSVNGIVIFSLGTITLATFSAAIQPVIRMAHDRVAS